MNRDEEGLKGRWAEWVVRESGGWEERREEGLLDPGTSAVLD